MLRAFVTSCDSYDARRVSALCERRQLNASRVDRTSVCMRWLTFLVMMTTRLRCCTYMSACLGSDYQTIYMEYALHERRKMAAASHVDCAGAIV